ncbi:MAG: nucleotide-binding universal stress UspA family protein [Pseudohongiellaceae bacterium]|jgi:nucleotide-binding universal stress UspA family protein
MKSNKYKILVLSDLKETASQTLSYAANLSKEIDADVEFFYVKKVTEIIETENPLSALREISDACNKTDKKIKNFVAPISKEMDVNIKTTFAFGNVKNEIESCINTSQPDMIILGERTHKRFNFFGDNMTGFVQKNYNGVVLVVTDNNVIDANGEVSLDNLGLKNNIANYKVKANRKMIV